MGGLIPTEHFDVERDDTERLRAHAHANWLPPEQWSQETKAAVEEMMAAAPERIERVVAVLRNSPVKVVPVEGGLLIADQAEAQVDRHESVPVDDEVLPSDQ